MRNASLYLVIILLQYRSDLSNYDDVMITTESEREELSEVNMRLLDLGRQDTTTQVTVTVTVHTTPQFRQVLLLIHFIRILSKEWVNSYWCLPLCKISFVMAITKQ